MQFETVLKETVWLLLTEQRVSYQRLRAQFELDETRLEALRYELIKVKQWAVDEGGVVLAWTGAEQVTAPDVRTTPRLAPIAELGETAEQLEPVVAAAPADTPSAADQTASDAERRPLTVMFCDLADSTALSTKLDPEDLQDVIRAYQDRCTSIIREYEGFVAKYMGDGILVYFGYPKSLERNAERAARTGLAIVEAMAALNAELGRAKGIEIAVRIGIATGLVMVGEVVGEGLAQERTVIGEAPNVAARLQGLAGRNGIVVGALTKEVAGDAFAYEELGGHELKGISGLVKAWGVIGLRDAEGEEEDEAETESGAAPPALIGRDEETGLLRRAWQSTKDEARGQVLLISGEAGIGKSALADGLRAEVRAEGLPQIAFRCSPYHTNSALYPVIEHVKRVLRWHPEDTVETRLEKLEAMLGSYSQPLAEVVPLFASLLSLPLPEGRYPPLTLSPQQQKQQTQDALIAWTLEEAERQPMLEVWEDLHWADPSTLELLGLLIEQAPTASLLVALTARPDFGSPWPVRSHITPITLNRLERPHTEALVARIAGVKPLPDEVVEHIVTKTDGVPLYVEELTKTILASDILRETGERFELTGPLSSLAIPETLQESLMARLDRLPQMREFAQLGSVLGREFAYEMISGLSTAGETTLQEGLGQLVESELLYQRGRPPRARYVFKHALVQDAAYQSLLRRTRQQYHQQVAELLESKFPDVVEAQPELLAHHYAEANVADRAVDYFQRAGERAAQRSANPEAIAHLNKGLELIGEMPPDQDKLRLELDMRVALGVALLTAKGWAAPETTDTFARARELCALTGNTSHLTMVNWGEQSGHLLRGPLSVALQKNEETLRQAQDSRDVTALLMAHRSIGITSAHLGIVDSARTHLERALSLYDADTHRELAHRFGYDACVAIAAYIAHPLLHLGYPEQARARLDQALEDARRLAHAPSLAFALFHLGLFHQVYGDLPSNAELVEELIALCADQGFDAWRTCGLVQRGYVSLLCGQTDAGLTEMEQGLRDWRASGVTLQVPLHLTQLAKAFAVLGQPEAGLERLSEALAVIEESGERWHEAEVHRLKGELLLSLPTSSALEATASFRRAIDVARSQSAKWPELRAATCLARLWQERGKLEEARELLAPVYDWFTEGLETPDLVDAKALMDDLDGRHVA